MHGISGLREKLVGILTLNYEDLLEKAITNVEGGVNYSVKIHDKHSTIKTNRTSYPVLKLHGSFNWKNDFPIILIEDNKIKSIMPYLAFKDIDYGLTKTIKWFCKNYENVRK